MALWSSTHEEPTSHELIGFGVAYVKGHAPNMGSFTKGRKGAGRGSAPERFRIY
jgi:hypothetical protein